MLEAKKGEPEIAIKLFKESLKLDPKDINVLNAWAKMERLRGNEAECEDLLRRALDIDPGHTYSLQVHLTAPHMYNLASGTSLTPYMGTTRCQSSRMRHSRLILDTSSTDMDSLLHSDASCAAFMA